MSDPSLSLPVPSAADCAARVAAVIGEDEIARYREDGVVCVRGLLAPAEIERLREGIEHNLAHPSPRGLVASRSDDPGRFFEDFCCWDRVPQYREFIERTPLAALAGALVGGESVRLYHDHLLVKEAGTRQCTPWHQDQPYYNVDGHQNVSMWIPVDPVPLAVCPEFVAGTHLGPWLLPRSFQEKQAKWFPEGSLTDLPDIDARRENFPLRAYALEPGDMICFNMLTVHSAPGSPSRRRAFSVRWLGDDMRHAPRPWKTSPDFPGLENELPAGAPMDHPLFPLLWRNRVGISNPRGAQP